MFSHVWFHVISWWSIFIHVMDEESGSRSSENRLLCHLPPSAFLALPHTYSVIHCAGFVGVLSHPCLSIHSGPSVPEPGNSAPAHRRKMEDKTWHSSSSSRCSPCPLSSHCPQWVHLTIYESPHPLEAMNAGRCSAQHVLSQTPAPAVSSSRDCFPRESQGSCVSPTTAAPLLFLQSTHHGLIVHVLYLFSVSPFYMVQRHVCFLGLHCTSREWHLSKPLLIEWMKVWFLNYLYLFYHGMCLLLTQPL